MSFIPGPSPFPMSSVSVKIAKAVPLISGMHTFYWVIYRITS